MILADITRFFVCDQHELRIMRFHHMHAIIIMQSLIRGI